jgi:hypothetical protein
VITIEQLARLVRDMRYAQMQYSTTRTLGALDDARQLERQVDKAIRAVLPPTRSNGPLPGQASFLDDEEAVR